MAWRLLNKLKTVGSSWFKSDENKQEEGSLRQKRSIMIDQEDDNDKVYTVGPMCFMSLILKQLCFGQR